MIFLQPEWVISFVFAYVYFNMSKQEANLSNKQDYAWLWALLSIAFSAFSIRILAVEWGGVVISQIVLFFSITLFRMIFDKS